MHNALNGVHQHGEIISPILFCIYMLLAGFLKPGVGCYVGSCSAIVLTRPIHLKPRTNSTRPRPRLT